MKILLYVTWLTIVGAGFTHWHGYNESLMHRNNPRFFHAKQCNTFHEATRPYSSEFYKKLSLWSDVLNVPTSTHGEVLYGSEEALRSIFEHQNPPDCKAARYLIFGGWSGGFGSRIHFEGTALSIAMQLGRVYLPHPDGDNYFWETNIPFCKDRKEPGFTCYFHPVSKCSYADALASTNGDVNKLKTYNFMQIFDALNNTDVASALDQSINLVYEARESDKSKVANQWIPSIFDHLLQCSPLRSDAHVYWWRAISAAYLIRPNDATKEVLLRMSRNVSSSNIPGLDLTSLTGHNYFNSPNSVAIHVRHGDKMREMKLVPWTKYAEALEFMVNRSLVCSHHKCDSSALNMSSTGGSDVGMDYSRSGNVFLITEDDQVLVEATEWSLHSRTIANDSSAASNQGISAITSQWNVLYSTFFNRSAMSLNLPLRDQKKLSHFTHHDLEYFAMLHNLMYAVKCHAYVCTLASNSCRLIDELRCTIGAKCNRVYADLSKESCYEPPCLEGHGYIYNFQA